MFNSGLISRKGGFQLNGNSKISDASVKPSTIASVNWFVGYRFLNATFLGSGTKKKFGWLE